MNNLTRNGVAKDLTKSPYIYTVISGNDVLNLHFSSKLHMKRFDEKRNENYNMIYNYIYKRFKYYINCRILADLNLYHKIETRGFFVTLNKEVYLCPKDIILNGENKMRESYDEYYETLTIS